jgi:hypothetical protein
MKRRVLVAMEALAFRAQVEIGTGQALESCPYNEPLTGIAHGLVEENV